MAIPKRHGSPPGTYFITSRTWESRTIFVKPAPCEIFISCLGLYRDRSAYLLHAFVLIPDHFHVLLTPGTETALEHAVKLIKGGSASRIRRELEYRFPVWQRGFSDHRICDAGDYAIHAAYIEQNPVKKGLASSPADYVWSSTFGRIALDDIPQGLKPLL